MVGVFLTRPTAQLDRNAKSRSGWRLNHIPAGVCSPRSRLSARMPAWSC